MITKIAAVALIFASNSAGAVPLNVKSSAPDAFARQDLQANLLEQGTAAFKEAQYTGAIAMLRKAISINKSSPQAHFMLARSYYILAFQQGAKDKPSTDYAGLALKSYEAAKQFDPTLKTISDPFLFYHESAMCYRFLNRNDEAIAAFQGAMSAAPNNPMPALYLSEIYASKNDEAHSANALMAGLHRARKVHAYRALTRVIRDDAGLRKILTYPKNRMLLNAYDRADQGAITEAQAIASTREPMNDMRDALASQPLPMAAIRPPVRDAQVLAVVKRADRDLKFQDYHDAIARYKAALDSDSRNRTLTPVDRSEILEKMANAYRQMGLTREAIRVLEQSTREMPLNPFAHYQLSLAYCVSGQIAKALNALDLALHSAPSPSDLRKLLLLARTDPELVPIRDLPEFKKVLAPYLKRRS